MAWMDWLKPEMTNSISTGPSELSVPALATSSPQVSVAGAPVGVTIVQLNSGRRAKRLAARIGSKVLASDIIELSGSSKSPTVRGASVGWKTKFACFIKYNA